MCLYDAWIDFRRMARRLHGNLWAQGTSRVKVLSELDKRGYGYADYQPGSGYGICIATRARIVEMAAAAGNWTFSSFFERAWSDHHDVYGFTRGQAKAPLIVEARGPVPAESNLYRWVL